MLGEKQRFLTVQSGLSAVRMGSVQLAGPSAQPCGQDECNNLTGWAGFHVHPWGWGGGSWEEWEPKEVGVLVLENKCCGGKTERYPHTWCLFLRPGHRGAKLESLPLTVGQLRHSWDLFLRELLVKIQGHSHTVLVTAHGDHCLYYYHVPL